MSHINFCAAYLKVQSQRPENYNDLEDRTKATYQGVDRRKAFTPSTHRATIGELV